MVFKLSNLCLVELHQPHCNSSSEHFQTQTEKLITLTTAVIKHILSVYVPWLHTPQNQIQVLTSNVHPVCHILGVMASTPQSWLIRAVRNQKIETFAYCFTAKWHENHSTEKLKVNLGSAALTQEPWASSYSVHSVPLQSAFKKLLTCHNEHAESFSWARGWSR